MAEQTVLRRVAIAHTASVGACAGALAWSGRPVDGLLLGGALAGFSFVTFWALGRTLVEPGRKALAYTLGSLKILFYFALTAAVLTGRLVVDPAGFALGVTCFVAAAVGVSLVGARTIAEAETSGSV